MLLVVGKIGCTKCEELKARLVAKDVQFEYLLFEALDRDTKRKISALVRNENNGHFPLITQCSGTTWSAVKEEGL